MWDRSDAGQRLLTHNKRRLTCRQNREASKTSQGRSLSAGRAKRSNCTRPSFLTSTCNTWLVRSPYFARSPRISPKTCLCRWRFKPYGASIQTNPACNRTSAYSPEEPGSFAGPRKSMPLLVTSSLLQDDALELPVFGASFPEVIDVRTEKALLLRVGRQRRAQVFVDQDFLQTSSLLVRSYEVASWKLTPIGS